MNPAILASQPAIVSANSGESFDVLGDQFTVKISGEQSGGAYAVCEIITPPGGGPPPHHHDREDEIFMIQSGRLQILTNGRWTEAGPGDTVFAPRGHVHGYYNDSDTPCRFWLMVSPAGFEAFMRELAARCPPSTQPDMDVVEKICAKHGIHIVE